jgi:hypothetical protein
VYQPPATKGWFNVADAAVIVQGMLPNTCRVVVAEAVLLPRRVRGLLPATAKQESLPEEVVPEDDKVAKLANVGRQRVSTTKRTRPIVKAREARKRRQDKALVASSPPATFGADNPPNRLKPTITLHQTKVISMLAW